MRLLSGALRSTKITNQPFALVLFPVQRCLPGFGVHLFPTGRMPPAKVPVTTVVHELEIVADTNQCPIDLKIFEPNFVSRLLIVPGKRERTPPGVRFTGMPAATFKSQLKQPAFNFNRAADFLA